MVDASRAGARRQNQPSRSGFTMSHHERGWREIARPARTSRIFACRSAKNAFREPSVRFGLYLWTYHHVAWLGHCYALLAIDRPCSKRQAWTRLFAVTAMSVWKRACVFASAFLYTVGGLYHLVMSPPLHLVYERHPPAGPSSVYVPGRLTRGVLLWRNEGLKLE